MLDRCSEKDVKQAVQHIPHVGFLRVDEGAQHRLLAVLRLRGRHPVEELHLVLRTSAQEDTQDFGDVGVGNVSLKKLEIILSTLHIKGTGN
jgi:hypothetical protein